MEGTLERKQKLQLGAKKVGFHLVLKPGNAQFLNQQLKLLSSFHRQPPEAGTPTIPSCTDTPCASMRTEKTHCWSAKEKKKKTHTQQIYSASMQSFIINLCFAVELCGGPASKSHRS